MRGVDAAVRRLKESRVGAGDFEISTSDRGVVALRNLGFSSRQHAVAQHKSSSSVVSVVTNRRGLSMYYVLLRMNSWRFWSFIVGVQGCLVAASLALFMATLQPEAALLALDANGLGVVDVECTNWACRGVAGALSLVHIIVSLFIGGVIVVRLNRVVAKHRFRFSKTAVLRDGEFVVRFFSNRPSMVVMPSFRLEYFDAEGRARPLPLINGDSIAYLLDSCLTLRHDARYGPFADADWRSRVLKVRASVMGFDDVIAQDVSGTHIWYAKDVRDDADLADVVSLGEYENQAAVFFHMDKIDELRGAVDTLPEEPPAAIDYSARMWLRAQMQSKTGPRLTVVVRRPPVPWHYLFLRMSTRDFWCVVVLYSATVTCAGGLLFLAAGETLQGAVRLSLKANLLSVGDVVCRGPPCLCVAAFVRLANFVLALFFGAIIIVRLSRVVVRDRFEFSDFCILDDGDLVLRLVSNRPSTVVMPTFRLEYIDTKYRLHPLDLTVGGTVAFLNDSTFFLRHRVSPDSPFAAPDWRDRVLGLHVAVAAYDELLAQEACGCRHYATDDIKTDVHFGPTVARAKLKLRRNTFQDAYLVDMSRINHQTPKFCTEW